MFVSLTKNHTVHLKPDGEICNRLKLGTKILIVRRKEEWVYINWRSGKKKGWIYFPEQGY